MNRCRPPINASPSAVKVSRNAGSWRGSLSAWRLPIAFGHDQQANERLLAQTRVDDLSVNDWAANSGINAIATNAVGTGLKPQSRLNHKRLGLSREQARELQNDIDGIELDQYGSPTAYWLATRLFLINLWTLFLPIICGKMFFQF